MQLAFRIRRKKTSGSLIMASIVAIVMMSSLAVVFLYRSNSAIGFSRQNHDVIVSRELMRSTSLRAEAFLENAVDSIQLNGRLLLVPGGPSSLDFAGLVDRYVGTELDSAESRALSLELLEHLMLAQAYNSAGQLDLNHPLSNFEKAFPSTLTDPDPNNNEYVQIQYEFDPAPIEVDTSLATLNYRFYFTITVKAYGPHYFSESASSLRGRFDILFQGAPFSKWATIVNELRNQAGQTLVFAGGDTADQIQSVYEGPVHINGSANFYGHPVFNDEFTTGASESSWTQYTASNYSCCAVFNGDKRGDAGVIEFPTQMYNSLRLAAGDTSAGAGANNSPLTDSQLRSLIEHHALGSLPSGSTSIPEGVYISTGSSGSTLPTGGIYVEGDAQISLNVVQGAADFNPTQFSNIPSAHQSCKFQKIKVEPAAAGEPAREILVGSDCDVTYVFNASDYSAAPVALNKRVNGNIFVNGNINAIGGESRTRPAIAKDFGFHVTALKDVRIKNDIQYEDAQYVSLAADGTKGTTVVATPTGEVDGSGVLPTDRNVAAKIDPGSSTVLGISSLKRNVLIHADAPSNINLHAAIYAGNNEHYDSATGLGCGANVSSQKGCGFGVENWHTKLNAGALKLLGSVAHYRSQTNGRLTNPPTGYESRYVYDTRLRRDIQPPAFPISTDFDAYPRFYSYRVWQLSQAE